MRKIVLVLIVVVGLGSIWFTLRKPRTYGQSLNSYFQHAPTLESGASVCVDGVKLGSVTSVRVRPELGDRPVEVSMEISAPYELRIPNDSTAKLSTEGLLGPTFVDINTRYASGPPLANKGTLKSLEVKEPEGTDLLGALGDALIQASRKGNLPKEPGNAPAPAPPSRK
jgi:phospholipid/cholesterol/gamma-HCH transport system substrate-binding protein